MTFSELKKKVNESKAPKEIKEKINSMNGGAADVYALMEIIIDIYNRIIKDNE